MAKNPILVGDNQQISPFDLNMSDDALVTFGAPVGPGALSFLDVGYMPVNEFTIGGSLQDLKGNLDGLFVHYSATGVQHFDAAIGAPTTADYKTLQYEIMGYKGDTTFGHAANGTPTLSGAKHLTVLAQGDLIAGYLGFNAAGGITGAVSTSMRIDGQVVGTLDFSVQHAFTDIGHTITGGLTLDSGTLHATFVPQSVG